MSRGHCQNCDLTVCAVGAEDPCAGCCACLDRCMGEPLDAKPDEVWDRDGFTVALWGQGPCVPYRERIDPIPSVYSSDRCGGQVDVGDYPFSLDDAEKYAKRVLAAVRWQRAQSSIAAASSPAPWTRGAER